MQRLSRRSCALLKRTLLEARRERPASRAIGKPFWGGRKRRSKKRKVVKRYMRGARSLPGLSGAKCRGAARISAPFESFNATTTILEQWATCSCKTRTRALAGPVHGSWSRQLEPSKSRVGSAGKTDAEQAGARDAKFMSGIRELTGGI